MTLYNAKIVHYVTDYIDSISAGTTFGPWLCDNNIECRAAGHLFQDVGGLTM